MAERQQSPASTGDAQNGEDPLTNGGARLAAISVQQTATETNGNVNVPSPAVEEGTDSLGDRIDGLIDTVDRLTSTVVALADTVHSNFTTVNSNFSTVNQKLDDLAQKIGRWYVSFFHIFLNYLCPRFSIC